MNRLADKFARDVETGRATELDPSTFDCPCEQYPCVNDEALPAWAEELQTQPERTGLNWHVLIGWPVMIAVGVAAWWLVLNLMGVI